jgi:hypothetical protein
MMAGGGCLATAVVSVERHDLQVQAEDETHHHQRANGGGFLGKCWAFSSLTPWQLLSPQYASCESSSVDPVPMRTPSSSSSSSSSDNSNNDTVNPLLFLPLDGDVIDGVVDEILRDPSINLTLIPDSIERRIYKSTIQLTLSVVYDMIASIDGTEVFAHEIHLNRQPGGGGGRLYQSERKINDHVLDEVADRLLLLASPSRCFMAFSNSSIASLTHNSSGSSARASFCNECF